MISDFITEIIVLPIIRRKTSPIPIGRIPGDLSKGMSRQAVYASRLVVGFPSFALRVVISVVQTVRANFARAIRRSVPGFPKFLDTSILFHPSASRPDGPLAPFVRRAAFAMLCSLMFSNITGSTKGISPSINTSSCD